MADCVLFTRIGLHIPTVWALFWVISTSVIQKKDDLTSGTRRSPMATQERLLCSIRSFHTSLRLLNLITPGEMPRPLVLYAPCQGLIVSSSIYLWLRHVISTAHLMLLKISRRKPFRVMTQQYALSSRNLQSEDTRANAFPVGCPNIPFSVP